MSWLRLFCPMSAIYTRFAPHLLEQRPRVNAYMREWEFDMEGNPYYVGKLSCSAKKN